MNGRPATFERLQLLIDIASGSEEMTPRALLFANYLAEPLAKFETVYALFSAMNSVGGTVRYHRKKMQIAFATDSAPGVEVFHAALLILQREDLYEVVLDALTTRQAIVLSCLKAMGAPDGWKIRFQHLVREFETLQADWFRQPFDERTYKHACLTLAAGEVYPEYFAHCPNLPILARTYFEI